MRSAAPLKLGTRRSQRSMISRTWSLREFHEVDAPTNHRTLSPASAASCAIPAFGTRCRGRALASADPMLMTPHPVVKAAVASLCSRFEDGGYALTPIIDLGALVANADGTVDEK